VEIDTPFFGQCVYKDLNYNKIIKIVDVGMQYANINAINNSNLYQHPTLVRRRVMNRITKILITLAPCALTVALTISCTTSRNDPDDPGGNNGGTGCKYAGIWKSIQNTDAPEGRHNHTAVWTGSEMIVWGGFNGINEFNSGGRYDPDTDSWIQTTLVNAPSPRRSHTAVWTGSEMIIWGGQHIDDGRYLNTGKKYIP
jgi:hypothetical protein